MGMQEQSESMSHRPPSRPESATRVRPTGESAPPLHDVIDERMRPVKLAGRLFE